MAEQEKKRHNIYTVARDLISGKDTKPPSSGEKPAGNLYEALGFKKKKSQRTKKQKQKVTTPDISRDTPKSDMPAPPYPKPKKIL